jgi:hypothetical protein
VITVAVGGSIAVCSQLRIRIEMAFGLILKKRGILSRPFSIKLENIKHLIIAIGRLHNYCIDERISRQHINLAFTQHEVMLRDTVAYAEFEELQLHY